MVPDDGGESRCGTDELYVQLRVWRGDAASGQLVSYIVPAEEGEVVLDVLHRLQATQVGDLAIRWNCKAGKCGSCSAEINGYPLLMCMTRLSALPPGPVTITPLRTFPVIRDLVTDVSFNYEKAKQVTPFTPPEGLKPGEMRMRQEDVQRSQEFRKLSSAGCARTSATSSVTTRRTSPPTRGRDSSSVMPS